jgi:hypothetical protein
MRRFRQNALALLPPAQRSEWDWLLLMQHYGVPTRLLDWTENALAALYFAVISQRTKKPSRSDGCVWCLDPLALNREAALPPLSKDIPCLDVDSILDEYGPKAVATAPTPRNPVAVLAMRQFPRLVAQSGVFTVIHRDSVAIESIAAGRHVGRILIPAEAKRELAEELAANGVTRLALFPELESVADVTKSYM